MSGAGLAGFTVHKLYVAELREFPGDKRADACRNGARCMNDLTAGDLFERIRQTMPRDTPGRLSRQQNSDVIAYLLKANGWPAGPAELPPEPAALREIRIQATRAQ